jgi:hypothetical protein
MFRMKKVYQLAAVAAGILTAAGAHAQAAPGISIMVTPWSAPNTFGSPSFDPAAQNQFNALRAGASSAGTPGTPTYYQAITGPVGYGANIATNFNSWMGDANPGAGFGSELGNRIHYGIQINGNGQQFSISQLSLVLDGDGTGDPFDYNFGTGYQYSAYGTGGGGYVGILKGLDGILGTADDTFVTSGAATQLVDGLIGRGSGNADAVYCGAVPDTSGPCGAGNQGYIDAEIAALQGIGFTQLTGTYSLLNANGAPVATGAATVHFTATAGVPEPATWMMMILGFGFIGAAVRRRRSDEVAALA